MAECICSSCRNLKGIMNEEGAVEEYDCEFGFPSDECFSCETGECGLACSHFLCDDGQEEPKVLKCKACGRELSQVCSDDGEGEVYCLDCYLKNM